MPLIWKGSSASWEEPQSPAEVCHFIEESYSLQACVTNKTNNLKKLHSL